MLPKPRNLNVERYIGGLSNFKKNKNPIKLSANESALGASPKAIKHLKKVDKIKFLNIQSQTQTS